MKFRGCDPCDPDDPDADPEDPCVPGVDDVARISNVLYENVYIEQPSQFALFIGPAQQYIINRHSDQYPAIKIPETVDSIIDNDPSPTNSTCSIMWPWFDALDYVYCVGEPRSLYENITLRNVTIEDPLLK